MDSLIPFRLLSDIKYNAMGNSYFHSFIHLAATENIVRQLIVFVPNCSQIGLKEMTIAAFNYCILLDNLLFDRVIIWSH